MVARSVLIANGPGIAPGAVATAQMFTLTGKTQGPCDYIDLEVDVGLTDTTVITNGVVAGLSRIEVTIDSSGDSTDPNTGNVFYTLYGGSIAAAYAAGGQLSDGIIETVSRMLFHVDQINSGNPTGTAAVGYHSGTWRILVGKNAPVQISVNIYMNATAAWCAAGWVYTGGFLTGRLYAHLVDSCADVKVSQTTKLGFGPAAESEILSVPDKPGYWFLGYALDVRATGGVVYRDALGGGESAADTVTQWGWARVANQDGVVFDNSSGIVLKAGMLEKNSPVHLQVGILDLYSSVQYCMGQYSRLMASPISAENLTFQVFPTSDALATDIWRIWYFYSKKGQAIKQTNQQQGQNVDFGAGGSSASQDKK